MMTVLAKMIIDGMDEAAYDQLSGYLSKLLMKDPGFMMHVAYPGSAGFYVEEVWQSRAQFERWFNEEVKPNVPQVQQEVIELHQMVQP
jgi:hypothetical protein